MPEKNLTDRQIAELYFGLARHYKDCVDKKMDSPEIYNALANGIYYTLNYSDSPLRQLNVYEHRKIYTVLNTFFHATPQYRNVPTAYQGRNFFNDGTKEPKAIIHNHNYYTTYYRHNNDFLFNWLLLSQLTPRPYYGSYSGSYPDHQHGHPTSKNNKKENESLAFLVLLLLSAAVAACALIALYYLLSETFDSFERFFCNEGWMQATMNLLSMAVFTTASTILASTFASSALFSLAVAAGVSNPLGWVTFGVVGLGIIGGALGQLVTKHIQSSIIKHLNPDALDPQDPKRFALTDREAFALEDKGIDPIKVKCAIVALRAELGNQPIPAFFTRWFNKSKEQEILSKIRALRSGALTELTVGDMLFNCRSDALNDIKRPQQQVNIGYPLYQRDSYPYKSQQQFSVQYQTAPLGQMEAHYQNYQYLYPEPPNYPELTAPNLPPPYNPNYVPVFQYS